MSLITRVLLAFSTEYNLGHNGTNIALGFFLTLELSFHGNLLGHLNIGHSGIIRVLEDHQNKL